MKSTIIFSLSLFFIALTQPASATVYHVRMDGDDNNTGTSWDQSFRTLGKALSVLEQYDEVWVAEGTYYPDEGPGATDNDRYAYFAIPPKSETILGGFPATGNPGLDDRDWVTYPCILSGDIDQSGTLANNARTVVRVIGALSFDEITSEYYFRNFDGFTITGGYVAPDDEIGTLFNDIDASGAGMDIYGYTDNYAIRNCRFIDNHAMADGCAGGALFMYASLSDAFDIQNCIFAGNEALVGGAMAFQQSQASLWHCTVYNNHAYQSGVSWSTSGCEYINSIFWGNTTEVETNFTSSSGGTNTGFFIFNLMDDGPDPLFVDADNYDFRLQACSPAIDAVNLAWSDQSHLPPTDYYLNTRPVDGNGDGSATSDIGVYEFPADGAEMSVTCQNVTIALDDTGFASVSADDLNSGSSVCMFESLEVALSGTSDFGSEVSFDCSDLGIQSVTLRAMDGSGNFSACEALVTIIDDAAPEIVCMNATVTISADGSNTLVESDVIDALQSYDNCGYTITNLPMTITCDEGDVVDVVLVASDGSGNTSTCVAQITIEKNYSLPSGWEQGGIGNGEGEANYDPCLQRFDVSGVGESKPAADHRYMVYQEVCGDFEFVAHVDEVTNPGCAGIELRETLNRKSRKLALQTKLDGSVAQYLRTQTGGNVSRSIKYRNHSWLKLTRQGNVLTTYTSVNGSSWSKFGTVYLQFEDCAYVGMFVESPDLNTLSQASFDEIALYGSDMGFSVMEPGTLAASVAPSGTIEFSAYPNPFSVETQITLVLPAEDEIILEVYDIAGKCVRKISKEKAVRGKSSYTFEADGLTDGMYIVRLMTQNEVLTRHIILSRK